MSLKSTNKIETNTYELEIEASAEEFEAAVQAAYLKAKNKINVPGFRKGKATRKMIENLYGESCFYDDAVNAMVPEIVGGAIDEAKLTLVDRPEIDVTALSKENGVSFKVKCITKPEVEISDYMGIEVEKPAKTVTDEDVEKQLKAMQEKNGRLVTVEDRAVENGDTVVIDFEGFMDGKAFDGGKEDGFELKIGSGQFIPGFEDQVIGHNAGESFDVNVKFPEEYTPELAGKDATFKVTLHEIKMKELPELDDEFAKDLDYDNVDELRKGVEADMLEHRQSDADKEFEAKLMEELVANVEAEIPEVMFDTQKEENINNFAQRLAQQGIDVDTYLSYMGTDKDAFESSMREQAVSQVKLGLALDKIAELEKIEVGAEDIEEEFKKLAEMYNMEVEKIKSLIAEDLLKEDLLKEKVVKFVVDNAKALKPGKKPAAKKAPAKKAAAKKADDAEGEKKPAAKKAPAKKKTEDAE